MTSTAAEPQQIVQPVIVCEDVDALEDLTPYDIYSSLTVKHSIPAEHVYH